MNNIDKIVETKLKDIFIQIRDVKYHTDSIGFLSGYFGNVLFLANYYSYSNNEEVFIVLEEKINEAIQKLNNQQLDITYSLGYTGIAWVLNYLSKQGILDEEILLNIDKLIILHYEKVIKSNDLDFLHGLVGIGYYMLERDMMQHVTKIVQHIHSLAILDQEGCKWKTKEYINNKETYNLSLSHGISSIIIFLSKYVNKINKIDSKTEIILNESVKYILSKKSNQNLSIYPSYCNTKNSNCNNNSRLAWCYGDLGIGLALWNVGITLKNDLFKEEALFVFEKSRERVDDKDTMIVDAGICHGTSGIAHIYNRLYKYTGNKKFNQMSLFWIEETIKLAVHDDGVLGYKSWENNKWINDYSFLTGVSGIGLVFISHLDNNLMDWDQSLFIS